MDAGAILDRLDKGPEFRFSGPVFETRDQIRAAALEEAAKVCDESEANAEADYTIAMRHRVREDARRFSVQARTARAIAASIRALKEAR